MKKLYASYEKQTETRIVREQYVVRIALGETKASILHSLSDVPGNATVISVNGDEICNIVEGWPVHGEICFEYEEEDRPE